MEVLSPRKRRIYFVSLTLFFFIAAPIVVLYASGYRLSSDLKIIQTGGIYVNVPTAGARFYLDDVFEGDGSFFQKSFFIQNLTPDIYTVRIEKEGHHLWQKTLEVFPTVISEGHALLLPIELELVSILEFLKEEDEMATGTPERLESDTAKPNPRYEELRAAFSATSTGILGAPEGATTTVLYRKATTTVYAQGDVGLWHDAEGLHGWWIRDIEDAPHVFCWISRCERHIMVWEGDIHHFDFLPGNNLFAIIEDGEGISVTEFDTREPKNTQPLYPSAGATFRVVGNTIYILDGEELFEVEL